MTKRKYKKGDQITITIAGTEIGVLGKTDKVYIGEIGSINWLTPELLDTVGIDYVPAPVELKVGDKVTWGRRITIFEIAKIVDDTAILFRRDGPNIFSNSCKLSILELVE